MAGVERIYIYENGIEVCADVYYFDKTSKTVIWNRSNDRADVLRSIDGYTLIEDSRAIKKF